MKRYGVFGYETHCETLFSFGKILPLSTKKINNLDRKSYSLSAFIELNDDESEQTLIDIEAILSFIEQKDVIINYPLKKHEVYDPLPENYPLIINKHQRLNCSGAIIIQDNYSKYSRQIFIEKALSELKKSDFDVFRQAFFKSTLRFKPQVNYLDVSYFLLFSGIEALARVDINANVKQNTPSVLSCFFKKYGFPLIEHDKELYKNTNVYSSLRNAVFHNGKIESSIKCPSTQNQVKIELNDYYSYFDSLATLVIMRYLDFDDSWINWNQWIDRQPFKSPTKRLPQLLK